MTDTKESVLIIGGGGREHALADCIHRQRGDSVMIHAAPGNPGIAQLAKCHPIAANNRPALCALAKELDTTLVVVGPETPLIAGLADELGALGLRVFGPSMAAAALEGSKLLTKRIAKAAGVPTAGYRVFTDVSEALEHLGFYNTLPLVIKADGEAAGKGVRVCRTSAAAYVAVNDFMVKRIHGISGDTILIEDYLEGDEFSLMAICDGVKCRYFPPFMDHKPIGEGDTGPNTGGMGAVTIPGLPADFGETIAKQFVEPILAEMVKRDQEYRGLMYIGGILTVDGPKLLEINCRFGDPETQVAMATLHDEDLLEVLYNAATHIVGETRPIGDPSVAAACIVLASKGYPDDPIETGFPITGLDRATYNGTIVYQAGTTIKDGQLVTAGGRVLGVTNTGNDLHEALEHVYNSIDRISFAGMQFRFDIGQRALALRS